jgi:1-pyrroline-5-carboxylate dehydrogenase
MAEQFKITYSTMSVDNAKLHEAFDAGVERVRAKIGSTMPMIINGKERTVAETFPVLSPMDTRTPLVYFQKGTRQDTKDAISAAKAAFPAWKKTPYKERVAILNKAADMISSNCFDIAAMMVMEMGKNRVEALGDVEETADLIRYYCHLMQENDGYVRHMNSFGASDTNTSYMKPYGVWAVISPFNFPLALAGGPVGAALVTGNTVVLKPSSDAPWSSYMLVEYLMEAGIPDGVINYITGPGSTAGMELVENPEVDGITFTGSYDIGFKMVYKNFAPKIPKPVVVEMGGKNPAIITDKADIDKAAQGVMRSAFGMGGQKCSACSRVYVHRSVYDKFMQALVAKTNEMVKIGDPLNKETFLGPLVNKGAYEDYKRFVDMAKRDGKIVLGGELLTDGEKEHGYYVTPTIVENLPQNHELVQTELFVPILAALPYDTLEEALTKANDVHYGLTAGIFSEDEKEVEYFLDNIESGVVYVNRPAGATTGAWPGYQTFGGWKSSGASGRNSGGPWTLMNYLREQSQTIIR